MSTLEEVREQIPDGFPCKDRCFRCCGPVPIPKEEWDRITATSAGRLALKRFGDAVEVAHADGLYFPIHPLGICPFLGKDGCLVYDERPLICRVYGQLKDLKCGEGVECPPELVVDDEAKHEVFKRLGADDATIDLYEKVYNKAFEV